MPLNHVFKSAYCNPVRNRAWGRRGCGIISTSLGLMGCYSIIFPLRLLTYSGEKQALQELHFCTKNELVNGTRQLV